MGNQHEYMWKGDASQLLAEVSKVNHGFNTLINKQKTYAQATADTIRSGGQFVSVLTSMKTQLKDGSVLIQQWNKETEQYDKTIKTMTISQQKLIEKQRERLAAEKELQAQQKLAGIQAEKAGKIFAAPTGTASVKEVFDYQSQIGKLKEFVRATRISAAEVKKQWTEVASGGLQVYTGELRKLQSILVGIHSAQAKLGQETKKANLQAARETERVNNQLKKQEETTKSIHLTWTSIYRLVSVRLAHQAISSTISALSEAVRTATELQIKIAAIQTIDTVGTPSDTWSKGIRDLSDAWGTGIVDQASAAYLTLSNQVAQGAESFTFLEEANRFAITSIASSADSVNLLTSAINAYGMSVYDTERIAASFFKTIELGRVFASQMANAYGRLAVPAAQLGVSIEELNAAVSVASRRGIAYSETATFLRNIMLKLIKPTDTMKEALLDLGYASGHAALESHTFGELLGILEEKADGSAEGMGEMWGRIRALSGAFVFAGDGVKEFSNDLAAQESALESYSAKSDIVMENIGKRASIYNNKIKNIFLAAGETVLEFYVAAADAATGLADTLDASSISKYAEVADELEDIAKRFVARDYQLREKQLQDRIKLQNRTIAEERAALYAREKIYKQAEEDLAGSFRFQQDDYISRLKDNLSEGESLYRNYVSQVKRAMGGINKAQESISRKIFEVELSEKDIPAQIEATEKRIEQFQRRANQAFKVNNLEAYQQAFEEVIRLEESLFSIAEKTRTANERATGKIEDLEEEMKLKRQDYIEQRASLQQDLEEARGKREKLKIEKKLSEALADYRKDMAQLRKDKEAITVVEIKELDTAKALKDQYFDYSRQMDIFTATLRKSAQQAKNNTAEQEKTIKTIERLKYYLSQVTIKEILEEDDPERANKNLQEKVKLIKEYMAISGDDQITKTLKERLELLRNVEEVLISTQTVKAQEDKLKAQQDIEKESLASQKKTAQELVAQTVQLNRDLKTAAGEDIPVDPLAGRYARAGLPSIAEKSKQDIIDYYRTPTEEKRIQLVEHLTKNYKLLSDAQKKSLELLDSPNVGAMFEGMRAQQETLFELADATASKNESEQEYKRSVTASNAELQAQLDLLNKLNIAPKEPMPAAALGGFASDIPEEQTRVRLVEEQKMLFENIVDSSKSKANSESTFGTRIDDNNQKLQTQLGLINQISRMSSLYHAATPPVGKAFGGFTSDTRDNIPAMLSRGEFVVNASSSRRFFTQLMAMNKTVIPGFAQGGPVSVGDVNIYPQATGNSQMDVIRIGQLLRQEVRRGTVRLQ